MRRVDIAILGAGCAGLSLAWQLTQRGLSGRRILLVDPRREYRRDRTWCFWNVVPHDFEDLVEDRYETWRVRRPTGPWVTRSAPGILYERLPADRFYARVLERLEATDGVQLALGERAGPLREAHDSVTIETDRGSIQAAMVFDSRPPTRRSAARPGRDVALLQHFEGWEVTVDRDLFEPGVATLMDFTHPVQPRGPTEGLCFTYVLPSSPRRGLVEVTWFAPTTLPPERYTQHLEAWLRRAGAGRWTIQHRERGVLPMRADSFVIRPSRRVHRIGLAGGAAKPSTGYAFQAIQTQSTALSKELERGLIPETVGPRAWLPRVQDGVFLSYLSRNNRAGIDGLVSLFEKVDPDTLVRFMSDRASPAESVHVMRAMPPSAMIAESLWSASLIRRALRT